MKNNGLIPKVCPSCGTSLVVEGVHLICRNKKCPEQIIMQILHWVQTCGMIQISESFVRTLAEAGKISSIRDLYLLTEKDFAGVDGFGSRKIENALEQISASRKMSIRQFVSRLGIYGIGEKAVEKLGINSFKDLWKDEDDGSVICSTLKSFMRANRNMIYQLSTVLNLSDEVPKKKGTFMLVCLTGTGPFPRKELIAKIEKMGYTFIDHVGKDTNILVCEDVNGSSGKLKKARQLGTKLVSYQEFFK